MKRLTASTLITLVCLATLAPLGMTQDDQPAREDRPSRIGDGARLVERLEQRIADLEAEKTRLQGAIDRIESGESPVSVMRELRAGQRDDRDDRLLGGGLMGGPRPEGAGPDPSDGEVRSGPRQDGERISPEEFIEMAMRRRPGVGERLAAIRGIDPDRFDREFRERSEHWRDVIRDPDRFEQWLQFLEVEAEIRRTAMTATDATGEERDRAIEVLRSLVEQQFEHRRSHAKQRLEDARRYVENLEGSIAEIDANREAFIDRRVREILSQAADGEGAPSIRRGRPGEPGIRRGSERPQPLIRD